MTATGLERICARSGTVLLAAVALAGALAGPARADVVTFTGESLVDATSWHVSTNWRNQNGDHVVPSSADDAVIPSGRTAALVSGDGAAQSVFLDAGARLDVDGQRLSVGTSAAGCSVFGGSCSRFAGIVRVLREATLVLAGEATWSNGGWLVDGTVENRGSLQITGDTRASASLNDLGLVRNLPGATITRAMSAGQADIAVALDNDGQVNVDAGTLLLQGGSGAETSSGGFTLAQAGTLNSLGGHRLSAGARVSGPGTLRLDGGDFEFAGGIGAGGAYAPGTTLASGGMLDLGGGSGSTGRLTSDGSGGGIRDGTLAVGDGVSRLDNITFEGGARVTFSPAATVDAVGTVRVNGEAVLGLDGDTTWSAGGWTIGRSGADTGIGGVVENRGDLRIVGNTLATNFGVGGGVVRNLTGATITRELSPGAAGIFVPLRNAGEIVVHTGTLETTDVAQSGGAIAVAGGATFGRSTGSPIALAAGALRGSGTVIGAVANDGATVFPGPTTPEATPGRLSITGTYTQAAGGALAVDIQGPAPATGHDQLAVSGTATLAGTLAITTGTGSDPPLDSTYDVVTAGAVSGTFASLTGAQLTGKRYQDEYEPTLARLRVVFAPIAPAPAEPIIFLPGFLGSRMVCDGSEAWPNPPMAQVLAMRLMPNGVSDLEGPCTVPEGRAGLIESAVTDVYGSTVEFLERIAPGRWHVFSYDWRKSPSESLQALDDLVERVRGSGKVVLLGHSMGGLVARSYIGDPDRAQKVARAVTLGGVYWGSPKALFPLAAGVETPLDSALNVLIPRRQMQAFARHLQGLYFLWPSTPYGRWLTVDGRQPRPLNRPGLLGFVQFLRGNERQLERALDGHARDLDRFETNGVEYHVVIGTGLQTIGRVRITPVLGETGSPGGGFGLGAGRPLEGIYRIAWANGDETVPRRSAAIGDTVPRDRLHVVCGINHLNLARDGAVTDRIGDFLRSGAPIAGTDDDCPAQGVEISIFRRLLGPGASASAGPADAMTPEDAERAGRIELLDLGPQQLLAANASRPVTLRLDGRRLGLRVTPLGDDGQRGRPRFYGPLSGSLTIGAGADAEILKDGEVVRPRRRADRRPPRTRARVRLRRRHALVRLRASDDSGVAATVAKIGRQRARRVRGNLRVKRAALARLRFQSVDVFGNMERPRRVRIKR